jgi:RHS repeat-associated protein
MFRRDPIMTTPHSISGNRYLFAGREWLPRVALYDYRNRVYSVDLGRFLQIDPIRFSAREINLYSYVANNAAAWSDPFGLSKGTGRVVCDGRGGFKAQYPDAKGRWTNNPKRAAKKSDPDFKCTQAHEQSHKDQWQKDYQNACKNEPNEGMPFIAGMPYDEALTYLHKTECNAYKKGLECRKEVKKTCPSEELDDRIKVDEEKIKEHCK